MANDQADFLRRAKSVAVMVRKGATDGEREAAANRLAVLALNARALAEAVQDPARSRFVGQLREISPVLVSEMGDLAVGGRSSPKFRVGTWVFNKAKGRAGTIQERTRPLATPRGPEHLFVVDGDASPHERGWREFDLRLATEGEVAAEQALRAAAKAEQDRRRAEWELEWNAERARQENLKVLRHGAELYAVAAKPRSKRETLCGRAWDGTGHVLFEAVGGVIGSTKLFGSKAAATRAYNARIKPGYVSRDASEVGFDGLCHQLVSLATASFRRRLDELASK